MLPTNSPRRLCGSLTSTITPSTQAVPSFRALVAMRVKPYYLHHPDLARGTGRFRGGIARGRQLMRELRGRASGLCQPTYVLDIPGGHGKVPIGPDWLRRAAGGGAEDWVVEDSNGRCHCYPPRADGKD